MPRIQILDDFGVNYQIVSSNPVIIAAWLAEIANRVVSASCAINHPVRMDIWPDFVFDPDKGTSVPDWTPDGPPQRLYRGDQMQKLCDLLNGIGDIPAPPPPPEPESEQMRREYGL